MKKKFFPLATLGMALATLSGCAVQPVQPAKAELTATHFMNTASLKDDDMEAAAMITTEKGWSFEPNLLFGRIHDIYLRAFIDKKTGLSVYQVYTWLRYPGNGWRHYSSVNYETAEGLKTAAILPLGSPQVDCSMRSIGCVYTEHMGFNVAEPLLRQWAATHASSPTAPWRFRIKPKSGDEYNGEVTTAEISGLLAKVDEYRLRKGLAKP